MMDFVHLIKARQVFDGGRFKGGSCGHNRCSIWFSCWSIIKTCYGGLITYGMTSIKPILS
ncbi:hypothetical protein Hanom_Chr10g00894951 [Helianthus anomalus]